MQRVFNKYNIPDTLRGEIFSYLSMRSEFNRVLHDIDCGYHTKILFKKMIPTGYDDMWGFPVKYNRVVEAQDIYRITWISLKYPGKCKIKVILSEKYSYQPDGWATLRSNSDPNIKCPLCFERMRYTDTERNHLTRCNCVYTSVLWEEAKTLAEQDQE